MTVTSGWCRRQRILVWVGNALLVAALLLVPLWLLDPTALLGVSSCCGSPLCSSVDTPLKRFAVESAEFAEAEGERERRYR